jgi:hypothetical protein
MIAHAVSRNQMCKAVIILKRKFLHIDFRLPDAGVSPPNPWISIRSQQMRLTTPSACRFEFSV